MKVQEIIELIDFISKKKLEEVKLETSEIKLSVKKKATGTKVIEQQVLTSAPAVQSAPVSAPAPQPAAAVPAAKDESAAEKPKADAASDNNYVEVKAPMIGTFYRASNPETPNFVEIGSTINKGDTVCIIEAMKLFNEIESEVSGTIVKVLVENASPVEFDQPLFLVDPS